MRILQKVTLLILRVFYVLLFGIRFRIHSHSLIYVVTSTINKPSYLILSYLILSYLILSYLILSYLILSYLILSYLILSYLILSYLILSYLRTTMVVSYQPEIIVCSRQ